MPESSTAVPGPASGGHGGAEAAVAGGAVEAKESSAVAVAGVPHAGSGLGLFEVGEEYSTPEVELTKFPEQSARRGLSGSASGTDQVGEEEALDELSMEFSEVLYREEGQKD